MGDFWILFPAPRDGGGGNHTYRSSLSISEGYHHFADTVIDLALFDSKWAERRCHRDCQSDGSNGSTEYHHCLRDKGRALRNNKLFPGTLCDHGDFSRRFTLARRSMATLLAFPPLMRQLCLGVGFLIGGCQFAHEVI
jgi:hypothetical protein